MKHATVVARLTPFPAVLPAPPEALVPILLGTGDRGPRAGDPANARAAAVLVLLAPDAAGDARVIFIERARYDGHHSGEIAFPGGAAEPGDTDPAATAVREAAEEIGLDAATLGFRVLGELETFWISVSEFRVTPILAVADRIPAWRPDPREVSRVIEAPLAAFLPGAPIVTIEREVRDWRIRYGAFPLDDAHGGHAVWGATARILGQLGALLGRA